MARKFLAADVHVDRDGQTVVLQAGSKLPDWAKELVTNPKAFTSAPESTEDADEQGASEPVPYAKWKKDDLVAELKLRELPQEGTNAEQAERLEADDAEKKAAAEAATGTGA